MRPRLCIAASTVLIALIGSVLPGLAQDFPTRPLKMIVPFPAGGPADIFARTLASEIGARAGQHVVIENRAGVAGLTGVDAVAKSPRDGYTIGLAGAAALSSVPFMVASMPFDWQTDLTMLTLVVRVPEVLVVSPKLGVDNVSGLVAHAMANPGKVNFASAGVGSITHLAGELFKIETRTNIVHVPYRGAAPATNDIVGGHVQMLIADVPVLLEQIRAGNLKALAVTSARRSTVLPEIPTTTEVGLGKVQSDNWYGLVAPAGLSSAVQSKLAELAAVALKAPALTKAYEAQSAVASPTSSDEFKDFVRSELAKWGAVIKVTGAKIQ